MTPTARDQHAPAIVVGTAGWTIPTAAAAHAGGSGSHLERYARTLTGVEINSSFYRRHAHATYARWAAATPDHFRFAVKVPRAITHDLCLRHCGPALDEFLADSAGLGQKRGPILVQLPPSHGFEPRVAERFFTALRRRYDGLVACEPRHSSWFTAAVGRRLAGHAVARVAADPAVVPEARLPGGWRGLTYLRWHGSPRMYWSPYPAEELTALARHLLESPSAERWCVFDNTAAGAAIENALAVQNLLLG